jgi:hypothetical protein
VGMHRQKAMQRRAGKKGAPAAIERTHLSWPGPGKIAEKNAGARRYIMPA